MTASDPLIFLVLLAEVRDSMCRQCSTLLEASSWFTSFRTSSDCFVNFDWLVLFANFKCLMCVFKSLFELFLILVICKNIIVGCVGEI